MKESSTMTTVFANITRESHIVLAKSLRDMYKQSTIKQCQAVVDMLDDYLQRCDMKQTDEPEPNSHGYKVFDTVTKAARFMESISLKYGQWHGTKLDAVVLTHPDKPLEVVVRWVIFQEVE